mmetsp:Transcript_6301/g.19612  ORF Transcript_6301/g.19612 Transcript_6301/m.19612 type:complete len:203 (+) Transcript_6301:769-1377(+)
MFPGAARSTTWASGTPPTSAHPSVAATPTRSARCTSTTTGASGEQSTKAPASFAALASWNGQRRAASSWSFLRPPALSTPWAVGIGPARRATSSTRTGAHSWPRFSRSSRTCQTFWACVLSLSSSEASGGQKGCRSARASVNSGSGQGRARFVGALMTVWAGSSFVSGLVWLCMLMYRSSKSSGSRFSDDGASRLMPSRSHR